MTTASLPGPRLRQLPRTIDPLHRETSGSYLGRLAAANRISHQELSAHVEDPDRVHPGKLTTLQALHCLSGHPVDRLLRALPDLRTAELTARFTAQPLKPLPDKKWTAQPVCNRCLAALGITTHASHHVPVSTNVCLRHGRWIGRHGQQLDLHTVPEVIRAQRHHYNLVRRHGQQIVTYAMAEATDISFRWWDSSRFDRQWRRRMTELSGPKWVTFKDEIDLVACTYPGIVALAGLFASAHLRFLPFTGDERDLRRFIQEVRDRAAPGYCLEDAGKRDPLVRWIEEEPYDRSLPFYPWNPPGLPDRAQVNAQ
ncbi:TniQ family protein [Streptomyces chrestomyceticus]|uniref:TniQ family protein n=1 Tax=Streptomyces chrestomyceticus TaxID=68185 RepID=UPI0033FAC4B6